MNEILQRMRCNNNPAYRYFIIGSFLLIASFIAFIVSIFEFSTFYIQSRVFFIISALMVFVSLMLVITGFIYDSILAPDEIDDEVQNEVQENVNV